MFSRTYITFALLAIFVMLEVGCANATAVPTATPLPTLSPPTATQTLAPPTLTVTPIPATPTELLPTATVTRVPSTATAIPPTATPIPPSPTQLPPTATRKPKPTLVPTVPPSGLQIEWLGDMKYLERRNQAGAVICTVELVYHNYTTQDISFPDYRPVFALAKPDGEILKFGYRAGGYFRKENGFENGIQGEPPTIPAGQSSFTWTWFGIPEAPATYCRYVYLRWQGSFQAAEFDANGKLINHPKDIRYAP